MALHAVDDLTDAFDATRSFLFPFEWGTWLRLALLSLFVSGSSGGGASPSNSFQYTMDSGTFPNGFSWNAPTGPGTFVNTYLPIIVAIVVAIFVVVLVLAWISSVFEFSFVESIRQEEVHVRQYFGQHRGRGTRLFLFRLLFGLVIFALVIVGLVLALAPVIIGNDPTPLLFLVALLPFLILFGIVASIVYVFTTAFVVPIMMIEDRGVLSGWRRLLGLVREQWEQFLVFVLVGLFLMIGIGIVIGLASIAAAIIVAIPFALVFVAAVAAGVNAFNLVLIAVLGIPFVLVMLVVGALIQVPVQSYLRYWSLLILGDVDSDLDLIPDQRAAVRE